MYPKQTSNIIKQGYNYISEVTNKYPNTYLFLSPQYTDNTYIAYDLICNIPDSEEIRYKLLHCKYLNSFFIKGRLVIYFPRTKIFNHIKQKSRFQRILKFFEYINLKRW